MQGYNYKARSLTNTHKNPSGFNRNNKVAGEAVILKVKELHRTLSRQSCMDGVGDDIMDIDRNGSSRRRAFLDIFTVSPADDDNQMSDESILQLMPTVTGKTPVIKTGSGTEPEVDPPSFLVFSIVTTLFLNPLFGGIGIYLSMRSKKALARGSRQVARRLSWWSLGVCVLGLCINVTIIALVVKLVGFSS